MVKLRMRELRYCKSLSYLAETRQQRIQYVDLWKRFNAGLRHGAYMPARAAWELAREKAEAARKETLRTSTEGQAADADAAKTNGASRAASYSKGSATGRLGSTDDGAATGDPEGVLMPLLELSEKEKETLQRLEDKLT